MTQYIMNKLYNQSMQTLLKNHEKKEVVMTFFGNIVAAAEWMNPSICQTFHYSFHHPAFCPTQPAPSSLNRLHRYTATTHKIRIS